MSSLFSALQTASNALRVFEKSIGVVQNNTVNASSPGYTTQQLQISALPFDPAAGWCGGITSSRVVSARNEFAESTVRNEFMQEGYASARATSLKRIEGTFDITGDSSLTSSLDNLFTTFLSWSNQPNDSTQRDSVLRAAKQFTESMNQTASDLEQTAADIENDLKTQVETVNRLAAHIRDINASTMQNPSSSLSNEADMYATLEELSGVVNFTTFIASDGSTTVLIDGQVPLVVGNKSFDIEMSMTSSGANHAPGEAQILDYTGQPITGHMKSGTISGLLSVRNGELASLLGNSSQIGSLNTLANTVATSINTLLESGKVGIDDATLTGVALFSTAGDATSARSLQVILTDSSKLAAVDPGPPPVANGIAVKVSKLASDSTVMPGGLSFSAYYGQLASEIGSALNTATDTETRQIQLVSQARSIRGDLSGVSLDEEAAKLMELQRSYEANSRIFTVANELMDTLLNLIRV